MVSMNCITQRIASVIENRNLSAQVYFRVRSPRCLLTLVKIMYGSEALRPLLSPARLKPRLCTLHLGQ